MNLYMISLGGKVKGCNLEVHDVQFIVANHIDETINLLKSNWYGLADKLHLDSYKAVVGVDGYVLRLTENKPEHSKQLFFVHMGGYQKASTQELHEVGLLVGDSEQEVKARALKEIGAANIENHVDSIVRVEACMLSANGTSYYIELNECLEEFDQSPDWFGYRRLDC
ncbi:MAG: hypothetical protein K0R46_3185 [Herbinix sp.]|jgi:hypothetical protein|nr:hypothetical protein [Herbinix sp.]